jgi:hypothetical protein
MVVILKSQKTRAKSMTATQSFNDYPENVPGLKPTQQKHRVPTPIAEPTPASHS